MYVGEPVSSIVHPALEFVPDDAVSQDPSLSIRQFERDAPWNPYEGFALVAVADIQPERSFPLQDALQLLANLR